MNVFSRNYTIIVVIYSVSFSSKSLPNTAVAWTGLVDQFKQCIYIKAAGRDTCRSIWNQWNERLCGHRRRWEWNHDLGVVLMTGSITNNLWWQRRPALLQGGKTQPGWHRHSDYDKLIRIGVCGCLWRCFQVSGISPILVFLSVELPLRTPDAS